MNICIDIADIFHNMVFFRKNYDDMTDEQIVSLSQKGDAEAFKNLYERYSTKIYMFIRKYMNNDPQSEDIFQEVFVKVYKYIDSFKLRSKFSTWIYRIATNTCINHIKKKKLKTVSIFNKINSSEDNDKELGDLIRSDIKSPEEQLENRDLTEEIYKCISELSEIYREPFMLYEIQEMKYEKISEIMKIPVGTVKFRIHSARTKLRVMLKKYIMGDNENEM